MTAAYEWRGAFGNQEVNALHAAAFNTRVFDESQWNWAELVHRHSLGWVVARQGQELVGFVNVLWDGLVHAWLQDTMVAAKARGQGIGTELVNHAAMAPKRPDASTCTWTSRTTCARSILAPAVFRPRTPGYCHSTDPLNSTQGSAWQARATGKP